MRKRLIVASFLAALPVTQARHTGFDLQCEAVPPDPRRLYSCAFTVYPIARFDGYPSTSNSEPYRP